LINRLCRLTNEIAHQLVGARSATSRLNLIVHKIESELIAIASAIRV
jgi:hypothetical protein